MFVLGLPDKRLYPSISAVYGNTEVSMVYLGPPLDGWGFARYIENTHCGKLLEKTQHSIAEVIYNVITLDVMCHIMRHIMSTHYAHLQQFLK